MHEIATTIEPPFRINLRQIANGEWRGDVTVRADTKREALRLAKETKKQVEKIVNGG